MLDLP
jgi:RNA recognition motif-containing protein